MGMGGHARLTQDLPQLLPSNAVHMIANQMTDQDWNIMEEFRQQEVWPVVQARRYSDAIEVLYRRLETETKHCRRIFVLRELAYLLVASGRDDESLSVTRQMIEIDPHDPLNWARLAGWYFWGHRRDKGKPDTLIAALNAIDEAVRCGRVRDRHNLRQCLNDRCRIVVAMKRWDLLEESLREILENRREQGIQFEDDFLRRVPEDAVDAKVMAAYKALLARQAEVRRRRSPPDY